MRKVEWTPDGIDSLNEIPEYYILNAGENVANNIYKKIMKETKFEFFSFPYSSLCHCASFLLLFL